VTDEARRAAERIAARHGRPKLERPGAGDTCAVCFEANPCPDAVDARAILGGRRQIEELAGEYESMAEQPGQHGGVVMERRRIAEKLRALASQGDRRG
jgi:hypothetical protein